MAFEGNIVGYLDVYIYDRKIGHVSICCQRKGQFVKNVCSVKVKGLINSKSFKYCSGCILSLYLYLYLCICICVFVYVYMYICI